MMQTGESGGAERLNMQDFRAALLRLLADVSRGADRRPVTAEEINRALARIDNGSFGVCRRCFLLIPRSELLMRPYADCCTRCSRRNPVQSA